MEALKKKPLQTSRRAKQSGVSILNNVVEEIVHEVMKHDPANVFRYKVDKKLALGYYDRIKQPICLEDMHKKAKRQEYTSIAMFKEDMSLMRSNAQQFNGAESDIAQLALKLEEAAQTSMESEPHRGLIEQATEKIDLNKFI